MKHTKASALIMAVMMMLALTSSVLAHANLQTCTPAVNATVAQAPQTVKCSFSQALDIAKSKMAVYDDHNNQVDNKDLKLDPDDKEGKTMLLTLNTAKMPNDIYIVKWTSASKEDGESKDGEWRFGVGVPVPAPATLPQTGADGRASSLLIGLLLSVGVLMLGVSRIMRRTI